MKDIREYHSLNSITFPDFVSDLLNSKYGKQTFFVWGKSGQRQNGIDIYSTENSTVIQCKYRDDNAKQRTKTMLKTELEKDAKHVANAGIDVKEFLMVSTYHHDVELQHYALQVRDKFKYKFNINYVGWEELRKWALEYPYILQKYFGRVLKSESIELVGINIDESACSWYPYEGHENVFYDRESTTSPFPVFDFTFINHWNNTIVLKAINLFAKKLYGGLSGLSLPPTKVESVHTYQMKFDYSKKNVLRTIPPIQIGADQAFRFKIQLALQRNGETVQIEGPNILFFSFDFNSNVTVVAPKVLLNTATDSNKIKLVLLS